MSNETIRLLQEAIKALKAQRSAHAIEGAHGYYILKEDDKLASLKLCNAREDAQR